MKFLKQALSLVLRLAISIILLLLLFKFQKVDGRRLLENIRLADQRLLAVAFAINLFTYILCLLRWRMLLQAFNIHLPLKRIIISFSGGIFFSSLLPSTIGGDVVRTMDLAAHTKKAKEVMTTVVLDRLSGCVALVIVAITALFLGWRYIHDASVLFDVAAITLLMAFVLFALFSDYVFSKINRFLQSSNAGKIRTAVKNLHEEIYYFKRHKKTLYKNLLFSLLIQLGGPLSFYITALALGQKPGLIYFFVFLPIIGAATLLPISIGGLGLRENISVFFFSKTGMPADLAAAMSFINSIIILILAAIGGIIYVLTIHHRRIQPHQAPSIDTRE